MKYIYGIYYAENIYMVFIMLKIYYIYAVYISYLSC